MSRHFRRFIPYRVTHGDHNSENENNFYHSAPRLLNLFSSNLVYIVTLGPGITHKVLFIRTLSIFMCRSIRDTCQTLVVCFGLVVWLPFCLQKGCKSYQPNYLLFTYLPDQQKDKRKVR